MLGENGIIGISWGENTHTPRAKVGSGATEQRDIPEDLQFPGTPTTSSHRASSALAAGSLLWKDPGRAALGDALTIFLVGSSFSGRKQQVFDCTKNRVGKLPHPAAKAPFHGPSWLLPWAQLERIRPCSFPRDVAQHPPAGHLRAHHSRLRAQVTPRAVPHGTGSG